MGTAATVLRYYEESSFRHAGNIRMNPQIILPKPQLVPLLAFDFALDNLSRLCAVLASYKRLMEFNLEAQLFVFADTTDVFNSYVLDVVDLLWRSRALSTESKSLGRVCTEPFLSTLRCYLSSVDREYSIAAIFGLSHNPAICAMSLKTFQELEDAAEVEAGRDLHRHVGPVSQRTLAALEKEGGMRISWKDYRLEVLDWLDSRGVSGFKDFMYVTMKDLRNARA